MQNRIPKRAADEPPRSPQVDPQKSTCFDYFYEFNSWVNRHITMFGDAQIKAFFNIEYSPYYFISTITLLMVRYMFPKVILGLILLTIAKISYLLMKLKVSKNSEPDMASHQEANLPVLKPE